MAARKLEIRGNLENAYADVFTPEVVAALEALAGLDADRKAAMAATDVPGSSKTAADTPKLRLVFAGLMRRVVRDLNFKAVFIRPNPFNRRRLCELLWHSCECRPCTTTSTSSSPRSKNR